MLIQLDPYLRRPLIVSSVTTFPTLRISGMIVVEAGDHDLAAFRDPAVPGRITGHRVTSHLFLATADQVSEGPQVGQWQRREGA